jgi:hypothetical protein
LEIDVRLQAVERDLCVWHHRSGLVAYGSFNAAVELTEAEARKYQDHRGSQNCQRP